MKRIFAILLSLSILNTSVLAAVPVKTMTDPAIAQTSVELKKVKQMTGTEFEMYLNEQADSLEQYGYTDQANKLRVYADANLKAEFENVIEKGLNDSSSNGLLLGVAIAGCASIIVCPILIFLAIVTFSDLKPASDI